MTNLEIIHVLQDTNKVIEGMNNTIKEQQTLISKLYFILSGHGCFDDFDMDFICDKVTRDEYLKKIKEN